jgi:hypothetical protein
MKAAFLFDTDDHSYIFRLIAKFHPDERDALDTMVWSGIWGLSETSPMSYEQLEEMVLLLLLNNEGSWTKVVGPFRAAARRLIENNVFAVVLESIDSRLAADHHQKMSAEPDYCGVIEVLANSKAHQVLFSDLVPTVRMENGKILVLHQDENDEDYANELIGLASRFSFLGPFLEKKAYELKFSFIDKQADYENKLLQLLEKMNRQWTRVSERVAYKLRDIAPELIDELSVAFHTLDAVAIDAGQARSNSANLRGCIESLLQRLHPTLTDSATQRLRHDRRLPEHAVRAEDYIDVRFGSNSTLAWKLKMEFRDINSLLNKGVHEDWIPSVIRPLSLRVIELIHTFLSPVEAGRLRFNVGDDLFST